MTKRRKKLVLSSVFLAAFMSFSMSFAGCGLFGKSFKVTYSDASGEHTKNVEQGNVLDILNPSTSVKEGYDFIGWYDSEKDGTLYVDATGKGVTEINGNITLYERFSPYDLTLTLDFPTGTEGISKAVYSVKYDGQLPSDLPLNLTLANKNFTGWYTDEGGTGECVANPEGTVEDLNKINTDIFDIDLKTKNLKIYAGFEWKNFSVTLKFESVSNDETFSVPYNTQLKDLQYKARNNGQGVLKWSETSGGEVFEGPITKDTTLYAIEWAPAIELYTDEENKLAPIVASEGTTVTLPVPEKDAFKFDYWSHNNSRVNGNSMQMPSGGANLYAVWKAAITFDENGGNEVDDICVAANEKITLPKPERRGYIFAGWYDSYQRRFDLDTMPEEGVKVTAGWYKTKKATINPIDSTIRSSYLDKEVNSNRVNTSFNLSEFYDIGEPLQVYIKWRGDFAFDNGNSGVQTMHFRALFYKDNSITDSALLQNVLTEQTSPSFSTVEFESSFYAEGNVYLYIIPGREQTGGIHMLQYSVKNLYGEVQYADTSKVWF